MNVYIIIILLSVIIIFYLAWKYLLSNLYDSIPQKAKDILVLSSIIYLFLIFICLWEPGETDEDSPIYKGLNYSAHLVGMILFMVSSVVLIISSFNYLSKRLSPKFNFFLYRLKRASKVTFYSIKNNNEKT